MPTIVLNQWEITTDYLEDDLLDGVMPVLFADDVKAAEAAISEAPLTAKRDLERLAKMYFVPETLDLTQAEAVVRNPAWVRGHLLVQEPQPRAPLCRGQVGGGLQRPQQGGPTGSRGGRHGK